ncbi:MAG: T9SS type A sorting domain-containing protein [Bacteroidota bacterium]
MNLLRYCFLSLLGLCFSTSLQAQLTTEQVSYTYQIAYCVGSQNSTAWIGDKVVIMIEGETPADRDSTLMTQIVNTFGDIIEKFEEVTGLDNLPLYASHAGKAVIEVVDDNCGAGGLASHGGLGMSTGKVFLDRFYDRLLSHQEIAVPQVFLYELNRNFWLAGNQGYNSKFDWAMNDEVNNYGWWTVGMNNAMAYMIPDMLGIKLQYFGTYGLDFWKDGMLNDFYPYLNDTTYNFDYGWRQSLMPWRPVQSINNLMSGLIIYSYENFGGENWLRGFYEQMNGSLIEARSGVFAYQECRDNVYKVWSLAADQDLVAFFETDLRWIISQEAKDFVQANVNTTSIPNFDPQASLKLYPNPVKDVLRLESDDDKLQEVFVFNPLGQVIDTFEFRKSFEWEVSGLQAGLYLLRTAAGSFSVKVEKK